MYVCMCISFPLRMFCSIVQGYSSWWFNNFSLLHCCICATSALPRTCLKRDLGTFLTTPSDFISLYLQGLLYNFLLLLLDAFMRCTVLHVFLLSKINLIKWKKMCSFFPKEFSLCFNWMEWMLWHARLLSFLQRQGEG